MKYNNEYNSVEQQEEKEINIMEQIIPYLRYWPLYICSVLLFVALAWLYGSMLVPRYPVTTSVLFLEEDKKGGGSVSDMMDIMDIASGNSRVNIDNEIQIMRSREILKLAILEAHDYIHITSRQGIRTHEWFDELPFKVSMEPTAALDEIRTAISYEITPLGNGRYQLTDMATDEIIEVDSLPYVLPTPYGILSLTPNHADIEELTKYTLRIHSPLRTALAYTSGKISIEKTQKTGSVAEIKVDTPHKQKGEYFLTKLIEVYNRQRAIDKDAAAQNTYNFINSRIVYISDELNSVEGQLEGVKRDQGVTSYEDLGTVVTSSMAVKTKEEEANTQLKVVKHLISYISGMSDDNYDLIPSMPGLDDQGVNSTVELYNTLVIRRNTLLSSVSEEHPKLEALEKDIHQLRTNILDAAKVSQSGLEITLDGLRRQTSALTARISAAPSFERKTVDIERQRSIHSQLYLMLLTKREETSIQLAATLESARIIDDPLASNIPSSPNKKMLYILGLILGIAVPTAAIFVGRLFRTKVTNEEELQQLTPLTLVGVVPSFTAKQFDENENEIVVLTKGSNTMTEVFRTLRTNINFTTGNKHPLTLICTSTQSGEGKTFISSNLAVSLSALDGSVLIVGLDIRNPQLRRTFHLPSERHDTSVTGMTDILNDTTIDPMEHIWKHEDYPNLSIIPAGKIPPNPSELLARPRLEEVFNEFKRNFDYIIVDCAPCGPVVDTLVLSHIADATLYTVRAGKTAKRDIEFVNYLSQENKLPRVCLVLNDLNIHKTIFNRRYGYGHRYGYGYGYDAAGNKTKA